MTKAQIVRLILEAYRSGGALAAQETFNTLTADMTREGAGDIYDSLRLAIMRGTELHPA